MTHDREPLFCDLDLAARIERAEARLVAAAGRAAQLRTGVPGFVLDVAGGVACFADAGSPFNKVAGLGFGGSPGAAELAEIESAYAARGAPVQVELAHLADPAVGALFTARGYRLVAFENVLGRGLDRATPAVASAVTPAGVAVRRSGDDEFDRWLALVADAVAEPDTQGVPAHEDFPRTVYEAAERDLAAAGVARYLALCDGVPAGGAGLRLTQGVAQFAGAATAPAHRRRGVQSALLAARLADAADAGCDVAVITTAPASRSQQNAQRRGFDLLYTRAILVKEP